jgi:SAM-dependent MidA family methyltransferase
LPDAPLFLIANEFFDALPIRQFTRDTNGWREHVVGLSDGSLEIGLSAPAPIGSLEHRLEDTQAGDIVETCAAATAIVSHIGNLIAEHGGAAILVDYGDWRSLGSTLQAVRKHEIVSITDHPGASDLSAHVDFEALAVASKPAQHSKIVTQGMLLERLGIGHRAQALAKTLDGEHLETHIAAYKRLTHPEEMGNLFKAIALFPETAPVPPGFST